MTDVYDVVAYDPGGTTGWCVMSVWDVAMRSEEYRILDNVVHWAVGEVQGTLFQQLDSMVDLAEAWPGARLIVESFELRQLAVDLSPARIGTAFAYRMARPHPKRGTARNVIFQPPSMALSSITDARLKAWGYYSSTVGQEHARDALRHAITWLRRAKEIIIAHD